MPINLYLLALFSQQIISKQMINMIIFFERTEALTGCLHRRAMETLGCLVACLIRHETGIDGMGKVRIFFFSTAYQNSTPY
jgi:hypothetical protein